MSVDATSTILEIHYERLRRFVRSRVSNPEEADDIVQEVCLRAVTRMESLREPERVESWLFQIARNAVIDHYRRNRPAVPLPETLIDGERFEELARPDLTGCMTRLLDDMDPADQEALRLTAFQGIKQRELAERLGISVSGAKSRVQRARQRLRDLVVECCRPELDRLGGVIDIHPARECRDDSGCACASGCPAC
jgi:RNA polymerase sigma-70 factor (ECF subfamily)